MSLVTSDGAILSEYWKSVVFEISSSDSVQPEQSAKNRPHSSTGLSKRQELWAMCEKQRVEGKKNGI